MKILVVHNRYRVRGGEERYVELLVDLLRERGDRVIPFFRDSADIGSETLPSRISTALEMFHSRRSVELLRQILEREEVDIAHVNNLYPLISPSILPELKRRGIPIVMTVHNHRLICPEGTCSRHGAPCELCCHGNYLHCVLNNCRKHWMESAAYGSALFVHRARNVFEQSVDRFITPTNFLREKLIAYGYPAPRVVHRFNPYEPPECPTPRREGGERYILYMGRVARGKGVGTLLRAMQSLTHVRLKIAGEGDELETMKELCRSEALSNVEFIGHCGWERLSAVLDGADFTVVPSACYENSPYAVLESLSQGKAVVASRIGGLPEIVEEGLCGLLFTPGDAADLAAKIDLLWQNGGERVTLGEEGRRRAKARFSRERYSEELAAIYRQVTDERG